MKGAEAALVSGIRVKVGRGDDCDIVVADSALAETAFELDVSDAAVTLVPPGGTPLVMNSFEVHEFGMSAFAVGPAEGGWEALRPAKKPEAADESADDAAESATAAWDGKDGASAEEDASDGGSATAGGKRRFYVCAISALLLLAAIAALGIYAFRRYRSDDGFKTEVDRRYAAARAWCLDCFGKKPAAVSEPAVAPIVTLRELAGAHGLTLVEENGSLSVSGNLRRRGERLAIRALALAADRYAKFDLSDDESFFSAADALLFTITEGCLKPETATNRVIALAGFAPSAAALAKVGEALRADVPWVEKVLFGGVILGGEPPVAVAHTTFARTGDLRPGRPRYCRRVRRQPSAARSGRRVRRPPSAARSRARTASVQQQDLRHRSPEC